MAPLELLAVVVLCCLPVARCQQTEIDLNGRSWTISDSQGLAQNIPAEVPGQVHLDLLRNGVIDDPYTGWNDWLLEWIVYDDWVYSRSFTLSQDDYYNRTVWLKCDGLDTVAALKVNGREVGAGNNMYRRYFFDITGAVGIGMNNIEVKFESAANYSYKMAKEYPYPVDQGRSYFNFSSRNFVRKTQSDFGWDFAPSFVPTGIWQNISVVSFRDVYVSYLIPRGYYNSTEQSYVLQATACFMLPAHIAQDKPLPVKATVYDGTPEESVIFAWSFGLYGEGEVCKTNRSKMNTEMVEKLRFWWPNGMGPSASSLQDYTIKVDITHHYGVVSSVEETKKTAFTRIDLITDPTDDGGHMFYFQLTNNGVQYPIYSKGSSFIPSDAFASRVKQQQVWEILLAAAAGNQNMIIVWGGGAYQPDWFYSICDVLGIMVWQQFTFAGALYPRDKDFLENVRLEIRHQLRRLMHHPSIVLWNGNNILRDISKASLREVIDYSTLYDETVRRTVWEEDLTHTYWASSPSNGVLVDDRERQLFIELWGDWNDPKNGDVHRWSSEAEYCSDVHKYPRPRFASEFGLQSYPSFRSLSQVSGPQDWSNSSPLMMHRQHAPNGNEILEKTMAMFFHLPKNENKTVEFMDFIYLSQVVQGICIRAEAEHYHRLLSEEGAFTRGAIYWQLNDMWQAPTWSSIDWSGQRKILHYFMKQVYEPITVSSYVLDGSVSVYVVVDRSDITLDYDLEVQLISWEKGEIIQRFTKSSLHSEGFTGVEVWKETLAKIFSETSVTESFLHITVTNSSSQQQQVVAETWFYPANFTDVKLPEAKITAADFMRTGGGSFIQFNLTSTAVAPFVYLENMAYHGLFNDNGFLMMPGVNYTKRFLRLEDVDLPTFTAAMRIRTVWETYSG